MTPDDAKSLIDGTIVSGQTGSINATKLRTVLKAIVDACVSALALKSDTDSPTFTGTVSVPLAPLADDTLKAASTSFVARAIAAATTGVATFNTRTGAVTLNSGDVTTALGFTPPNVNNAALTGVPTAPSAADGTNTTQLSTTAFVQTAIGLLKSTVSSPFDTLAKIETALGLKAPLANPTFTGTVTIPTASPGDNTTKAASTAFVTAAVAGSVAGVASYNGRTGTVTATSGDITTALGYTPANVASPALTGTPTTTLAADGTNTSQIASTTFVQNAIVLIKGGVSVTYDTLQKLAAALILKADIASPTFTGVPSAPTAAGGTNTTQIATTQFVTSANSGKIDAVTIVNGGPTGGQYLESCVKSISGSTLTLTFTKAVDQNTGGGGGTCFPAGSMVRMADGTDREITEVLAGEFVWSPTGPAEVERLDVTTLAKRALWRMVDGSISWSDEHTFVVDRHGERRLWSMNVDRLMWEADAGDIGGIEYWEWMLEGEANRAEYFLTIDGTKLNAPERSRNGVKGSMPLYVPITKNGELIAVNGYVVGAGLNGAKCDYRSINWQR